MKQPELWISSAALTLLAADNGQVAGTLQVSVGVTGSTYLPRTINAISE